MIEYPSPEAIELAAGFQLSPYFHPVDDCARCRRRSRLLLEHRVDGIVRIPADFSRRVARRRRRGAADRAWRRCQSGAHHRGLRARRGRRSGRRGCRRRGSRAPAAPVNVQSRLWFNEANDSRYFLVPGLIVLVMTLIGGLLTAMVMAREWERGTLESLFVTPVRSEEILLGKTLPYFVLALVGFVLCVLSAKFLFHVPLRGSLWVLLGASMLYVLVALGIGLLISSWVKNQLVASQLTMLVTFLPAFMLSGFLFDLRSVPTAVRLITYVLPARYYVALLQSVFLAGDVWAVIVPEHAGARGDGGRAGARQPRRDAQDPGMNRMLGSLLRILALTRKELLAVLKDPRSRMSLLIPPMVQALIFGYAATYDLNHVPYAVLDQDHSAASRQLLAGLDGSGVFERVADLQRAGDIKSLIDARRALLVVQIDQQFERQPAVAARAPTCR